MNAITRTEGVQDDAFLEEFLSPYWLRRTIILLTLAAWIDTTFNIKMQSI